MTTFDLNMNQICTLWKMPEDIRLPLQFALMFWMQTRNCSKKEGKMFVSKSWFQTAQFHYRLKSTRRVVYTLDEIKLVYWAKADIWKILKCLKVMQSKIKFNERNRKFCRKCWIWRRTRHFMIIIMIMST